MALDVLIVDDSAAIRKVLKGMLSDLRVPFSAVREASDGCEALEMLKTGPVGLIFSDISMPNMDGIELLTQLKASDTFKSIPIVMVTMEGSQAKVLQALQLGANAYVRKPFTTEQIKETLAGIISP